MDIEIGGNHDREHECAGHNSLHPMVIEQDEPFDAFHVFTVLAVIALCVMGMVWLLHSMFS